MNWKHNVLQQAKDEGVAERLVRIAKSLENCQKWQSPMHKEIYRIQYKSQQTKGEESYNPNNDSIQPYIKVEVDSFFGIFLDNWIIRDEQNRNG